MSDKYLTEKEWKVFCKNPAYKGAALAKALAGLDKAEHQGPDTQLKALDEIDQQSNILLKANKGDKVLSAYLGEIEKAGKKLRKEAENARAQAAKESAESEDEEPGSVLLDPKKLLAQLNLCKRDPERVVQFGFVDGKDKQEAVLALSPKLSGRKLFSKLQAETGVKTGAFGNARIEGTILILQLEKPLSGLLKKIRLPVKACGFRISKAVLRSEDGTVFEQDEHEEHEEQKEVSAKEAGSGAPGPASKAAPEPARVLDVASDEGPVFNTRLAALLPAIKAAAASANAATIKAKAGEAGVLARSRDFKSAHAALDELEQLLHAPSTAPAAPSSDAGTAFKAHLARLVPRVQAAKGAGHPALKAVLEKVTAAGLLARQQDFAAADDLLEDIELLLTDTTEFMRRWQVMKAGWRDAIEAVDEQIAKLQARLRNDPDPELQQIAELGLNALTGDHKVPLMTALMDVDQAAPDAAAIKKALGRTASAARAFQAHLQNSPIVAASDSNPFGVTLTIRSTLGQALGELTNFIDQE